MKGPIVALPAATRAFRVAAVRPARSPRTSASPALLVVKRRVTLKRPVEPWTVGAASDLSTVAFFGFFGGFGFGVTAPENVAVTEAAVVTLTVQVVFLPV